MGARRRIPDNTRGLLKASIVDANKALKRQRAVGMYVSRSGCRCKGMEMGDQQYLCLFGVAFKMQGLLIS